MKALIAVATHKSAWMPQDALYLPVQAGAAVHPPLPYASDNAPGGISRKNDLYCELTVLHYLWKHVDADVLGLAHYRRHFSGRRIGKKAGRILTGAQLEQLMTSADVIVPTPRLYLIETNFTQYAHAHSADDLTAVREVLAELHPDYLPDFDRVMQRRWGRRFNMCIMRRELLDAYCAWLFSTLFAAETRIEPSPRVMGYLAERLLDVWLMHNKPRMKQLPVIHLESQHWPRKIASFLKRKFSGGVK